MSARAIRLDELTKTFAPDADPAVDRLTLDIPGGSIVALIGPSGCGKTTTMRMINRLIEPTSGEIRIDGSDVMAADPVELRRARDRDQAEAEARATYTVSQAIEKGDINAVNYFIATKYVDALKQIASAENEKLVLMPLEASGVIGAIGGIGELAKEALKGRGSGT